MAQMKFIAIFLMLQMAYTAIDWDEYGIDDKDELQAYTTDACVEFVTQSDIDVAYGEARHNERFQQSFDDDSNNSKFACITPDKGQKLSIPEIKVRNGLTSQEETANLNKLVTVLHIYRPDSKKGEFCTEYKRCGFEGSVYGAGRGPMPGRMRGPMPGRMRGQQVGQFGPMRGQETCNRVFSVIRGIDSVYKEDMVPEVLQSLIASTIESRQPSSPLPSPPRMPIGQLILNAMNSEMVPCETFFRDSEKAKGVRAREETIAQREAHTDFREERLAHIVSREGQLLDAPIKQLQCPENHFVEGFCYGSTCDIQTCCVTKILCPQTVKELNTMKNSNSDCVISEIIAKDLLAKAITSRRNLKDLEM